jgi:iron complex outermembrane recepter protein
MTIRLCFLAALFLWHSASAAAQSPADTIRVDTLPVAEVRATRSTAKSDQNPLAVSVLDASRIRVAQPLLSLAESLPAVPGVFVMNDANFAQDLRIAVRGFGARAGFGIRGVKILLDGIPESSPDGQGQVDNIDPAMLGRIEVLRGASAGLYGNAAGGVISLSTQDIEKTSIGARTVLGSFGFRQFQLNGAYLAGNTRFSAGVTRVSLDGFREQAAMRATLATAKMIWIPKADSSLRITLLANFTHSPQGDDPGGLTAAQDSLDRRAAHPANVQFDAGESLRQGRIALLAGKQFSARSRLHLRLWSALRDFENRLPFRAGGQVAFQRWAGGGVLQFEQESRQQLSPDQPRFRWSAGIEADRQADDRQRFDNENGQRGILSLRQDELFGSWGLFALGHWQAAPRLTLSGGARADAVRLRVRDRFLSDGDQSGAQDFRQLSPWSGFAFRIAPRLNVYGNVSTNFETPTLIELSNNPAGTGGFAEDLKPQRTLSSEIGIRGRGKNRLLWEIAVFQARTRDELTPYELPDQPGRIYFRNAGQALRRGIETALNYAPVPGWECWANYTLSDFRFERFEAGNADFSGKALPGLPQHLGQVSSRFTHRSGMLVQVSGRFTGSFYAENANAVSIPATQVYAARVGWTGSVRRIGAELFLGADNLGNARLFNNVRLNAAGGRYYESGAGRSFFVGLAVQWL